MEGGRSITGVYCIIPGGGDRWMWIRMLPTVTFEVVAYLLNCLLRYLPHVGTLTDIYLFILVLQGFIIPRTKRCSVLLHSPPTMLQYSHSTTIIPGANMTKHDLATPAGCTGRQKEQGAGTLFSWATS